MITKEQYQKHLIEVELPHIKYISEYDKNVNLFILERKKKLESEIIEYEEANFNDHDITVRDFYGLLERESFRITDYDHSIEWEELIPATKNVLKHLTELGFKITKK